MHHPSVFQTQEDLSASPHVENFGRRIVDRLLPRHRRSAKDTQFWNLTANTITALEMSPAGKDAWGADQTANDRDHSVEHDERLKITGVNSGPYDVRFTDKAGRFCVVKDVAVSEGAVFTIDEKASRAAELSDARDDAVRPEGRRGYVSESCAPDRKARRPLGGISSKGGQ